MMSMLPLMTTNDLFGLVLTFIIVEHGEKFLNMGKDLSWVVVISLFERVWRDFDLCLSLPMSPWSSCVRNYVGHKNRMTLTMNNVVAHY